MTSVRKPAPAGVDREPANEPAFQPRQAGTFLDADDLAELTGRPYLVPRHLPMRPPVQLPGSFGSVDSAPSLFISRSIAWSKFISHCSSTTQALLQACLKRLLRSSVPPVFFSHPLILLLIGRREALAAESSLVLQSLVALKLFFVPHAGKPDEHQDNNADNDCRHIKSRTAKVWRRLLLSRCGTSTRSRRCAGRFYWANLRVLASLH
jgi:hypothetical protein